VVETNGALIQGFWGNGRFDFGLVQSKLENPADTLTTKNINVSLRGTIVLGGHCEDINVLQKASDVPIRGLIISSMPARLIPTARQMSYPIIVLEGFGKFPLNPISYNLLTTHENREITVNAEVFDSYTGQRPEVVIPLPTSRELDLPMLLEEFSEGQSVRILRAPYQCRTGSLDLLYNEPVEFPSGIRAQGALVSLENGESVQVPLANLEVVN
jgi:hypothetical protein